MSTDSQGEQVLVINSGSSSIKYRLFGRAGDGPGLTVLTSGLVERIGEIVPDHDAGFATMITGLRESALGDDLVAIGHRVVHGGAEFVAPTRIDAGVVDRIRAQIPLAPLHNPGNLAGIEVAARMWPDIPQVAVFDTAFHASLPPRAYRYAVPDDLVTRYGVRRYGFHGTSHAYVARRAAEHLRRPLATLRCITLHLGNGSSAAAIQGGRSIDTSMGLTPLEGLVMGTRSGDLDPAVIFHLARTAGMDLDEIAALLHRRSGLLGLCGDNDVRAIEQRVAAGDAAADLALEVYAYRIRKYLGAYTAAMGGLDVVVFTAGIGENAAGVRARATEGLEVLGIRLDARRNLDARPARTPGGVVALHPDGAEVAVLAIATDEEHEIAVQTLDALGSSHAEHGTATGDEDGTQLGP